jgi:hypothetical protein
MKDLPVLNKPKRGDPCNSCGLCCIEEACGISVAVFGDDRTPCAALEKEGDKFLCGLIRSPQKYVENMTVNGAKVFSVKVAEMLGVGKGCCADFICPFCDELGAVVIDGEVFHPDNPECIAYPRIKV